MAKQTRDDATSGVTAVLSILKDAHNDVPLKSDRRPRGSEPPRADQFTILVWLIGRVLMPPYLPRITARAEPGSRKEIQDRLRRLAEEYEDDAEFELTETTAEGILEKLRAIGRSIANYPHELHGCLRLLSELGIKHLIIHTDEYSVPWALANYLVKATPDRNWESEFLCDLYSCGTVLVDDRAEPLPRFVKYNRQAVRQPDINGLGTREICLIAGEVGQKTEDGKDVGLAYVHKLKSFLESSPRCSTMTVRCIEPSNWQSMEGTPEVAVGALNKIFKKAQIVHFTGHVKDGKMQLAKDVLVGPRDLAGLVDLDSKPLVVLHGCSSVGPAGATGEETQLCKAFLDKGAGGCLATVFPVNIPIGFSGARKTLVEIFYENVFKQKPYGAALRDARETFRKLSLSKKDPQALFYQLFGDPRETLVAPNLTVAERLAQAAEYEADATRRIPYTLRITGAGIDEKQLLKALGEVEGIEDPKLVEGAKRQALLGDPALLGDMVSVVSFVFAMLPVPLMIEIVSKKLNLSPGAIKSVESHTDESARANARTK